MKIEHITKLKNGKYKIKINDDTIVTYDDVIIKNGLLFKKEITDDIYKKIIEDTNYYEIYNKCINLINKKLRSENEVRKYLIKMYENNNHIDDIINKLKNINLINDQRYAQAYINDKIYLSNYGVNRIKQELLKNKVSEEIINQELLKIDNNLINNKLERLIQKKIKSNTKYSSSYLKNKILSQFINMGYKKDEISLIIDKYEINDFNAILKEYNKIKNKDKNTITNKLLSKGFKYDDILNIIKTGGE